MSNVREIKATDFRRIVLAGPDGHPVATLDVDYAIFAGVLDADVTLTGSGATGVVAVTHGGDLVSLVVPVRHSTAPLSASRR